MLLTISHLPFTIYHCLMSSIIFLDVDAEDQPQISAHFPDATILSHTLQEAFSKCKDTEVLSVFITSRLQKEDLDKLPNLKLIATRSVGYDHIDLDECHKRGITVCNVPDYGSHVIAEHVFALLLSTLRHIPEADARVESGTFEYQGLRGMAMRGKTIGIVGTGRIGRRVAQIAHGLGMNILAVDKCRTMELQDLLGVRYVEFDELLNKSNIITLHVPALKETEHMVNANSIRKMKDGVVLVNTARGSLIDSEALLDALKSGKVAYALLDVLEHEQNFQESKELIEHEHTVTTPHIAFYADDSMHNMYADCFVSIEEWQRGEDPEHIVQPPEVICDLPGVKSS